MNDFISYDDLKKVIDLLSPKPPNVEIWVNDHIPSGQAFKVVLKDIPISIITYLPRTDEIYLIGTEDFHSLKVSETLSNSGIPVFGPDGIKLC